MGGRGELVSASAAAAAVRMTGQVAVPGVLAPLVANLVCRSLRTAMLFADSCYLLFLGFFVAVMLCFCVYRCARRGCL